MWRGPRSPAPTRLSAATVDGDGFAPPPVPPTDVRYPRQQRANARALAGSGHEDVTGRSQPWCRAAATSHGQPPPRDVYERTTSRPTPDYGQYPLSVRGV